MSSFGVTKCTRFVGVCFVDRVLGEVLCDFGLGIVCEVSSHGLGSGLGLLLQFVCVVVIVAFYLLLLLLLLLLLSFFFFF